jgi:hypothetical protein
VTRGKTPRVQGDVIPASAYEPMLKTMFGMAALRRGPHWQLAKLDDSPFGPIDEAKLLSESIADVMKYVPLPQKELGVFAAITNLSIALYSTVGTRLQIDEAIKQGRVTMLAPQATAPTHAAPAPAPVRATPPPAPAPAAQPSAEPTAADLLDGLRAEHGDVPLAAVTHQIGDPIADGVQLGHAPTQLLGPNDDPEPALLEAFRPGESAVPIEQLVEANGAGVPLLDRLAPAIEVDGVPAARELGDVGVIETS